MMPIQEALDRRGRAVRGSTGLLEREVALDAIDAVLDELRTGTGGALLIEGHAGMGKTRLHEAALDRARERELQVLRAAGAELEQSLAFGVAAQLLVALLDDLPAGERPALLKSAPASVRALIGGSNGHERFAGDLGLAHGLFSLIATLGETQPALIAIDDLHWCDGASLEVLAYLLHRLDELPVAIVMTRRHGLGQAFADVLDRIATHPSVAIQTLSPLGGDAVHQLARQALGPRADADVVDACRRATAGNPFYLRELLTTLADDPRAGSEELTSRALALAPDAVSRAVRIRVGRLGESAARLASAVSVLGDDVPLRHAAALSGLRIGQAVAAADALAAVEVLLAREPLRFVHPLVRRAIEQDVPAGERASRHLEAARLLYAEGAGAEKVAAHLLLGRPQGDPWVVEQLRSAAREARARGSTLSSISYLKRALEEPPLGELRAEVLGELGEAEAEVGMPDGPEHLAAAAAESPDPLRRAELALARGHAFYAQGRHEQAAEAYNAGLQELPRDPDTQEELELYDELQTGYVATASLVAALQAGAVERSEQLLKRSVSGPRTHGQRLLLAQAAVQAAFAGRPANEITDLAERAWDGGRLLERETAEGVGWSLATAAFTLSGELERCVELVDTVLEDARRRSSPLAFATASYVRGLPQLWQGQVSGALADLEQTRQARRYGWRQFSRAAAAHYVLCRIETGELELAEEGLTEAGPLRPPQDLEGAFRFWALAELRLAQGRAREAYETALDVGQMVERTMTYVGFCPWRVTAAQAASTIGEDDRATELAREQLEIAERTDVLHARIAALRLIGLCEREKAPIESLKAAVELGSKGPPRLETIRALVDLGAALRRGNHRAEARAPLRQAADLAQRGGAIALHERAVTELAATGARPRRQAPLSGPASLTPSERRIAELAASGHSNREIARTLFVTPKTVEYHLRNAYRKLEIEGRHELGRALAA